MTSEAVPAARRPPEPVPVRHGAWSFELRGDELADIRYDGVLLLRAVRPVVRDRDWRTVPASEVRLRVPASGGDWSAALTLRFRRPGADGVDYAAEVDVVLDGPDLTVGFTGTSRSTFARNRIGLVVLHPLTEAGRPVEVVHSGGSVACDRWPEAISPHQPFLDVHGFRWEREGVHAELSLDGDVFETEDQRNWTDASFKTYGTPLSEPFPVEVRPGDRVLQRLRVRAAGERARPTRATAAAPSVDVLDRVVGAVPAISLGATAGSSGEPGWAARSGFETVLLELVGPPSAWSERVACAEREAGALGAALDVRVATADPDLVPEALALLDPARVARLAVFDTVGHVTTGPHWRALLTAAAASGFHATLVAGARSHFAELNRGADDLPSGAEALTCSITPQMHATELPHVVESLAGQEAVARDAVRLAGGRPVHLGPVTLRQRFNAVATSGDGSAGPPDPLQPSTFTAAWTLGSVAALTRPGVEGLCYYEVSGPGGIGDAQGPYPVGRVLATLAGLRGADVLAARAPAGVVAYPVRTPDGVRVLLSRLGDTGLELAVAGPDGTTARVRLEPWSVAQAGLP